MSESNKNSKKVFDLLKSRPLGEFLRRNLSYAEIENQLNAYDEARASRSEPDRRANLIVDVMSGALDKINLIVNEEALIEAHQFPPALLLVYLREFVKQATVPVLMMGESDPQQQTKLIETMRCENEAYEEERREYLAALEKGEMELREKHRGIIEETEDLLRQMEERKLTVDANLRAKKIALETRSSKQLKKCKKSSKSLTDTVNAFTNTYEQILAEHQTHERKRIGEKLKAEQALQTILRKFDNDIGSRAHEIDAIEGEIDAEKKKFERWKSTICARQEAEYARLMREKEEEEARERAERLEQIRREHAARVIQAGWRKFAIKRRRKRRKNKATKRTR